METARLTMVLASCVTGLAACMPALTVEPSGPQTAAEVEGLKRAHPELTNLTFAVAAEPGDNTVDSNACNFTKSPDGQHFIQSLFEQRMSHAGFHIAPNQATAQVVATASASMEFCQGKAKMGEGTVTYRLKLRGGDGGEIDIVNKTYQADEIAKISANDKYRITDDLIIDAENSPKLAKYAADHGGGASVSPSAVAAPPPAASGCAKDTDCKGDRVCESGACVAPH